MFVPEVARQPDCRNGLQACRVSQKLAEMIMIGALKLVFDQNQGILFPRNPADNVGTEGTNRLFHRLDFKTETKCFTEDIEILRLRQPRREPYCFTRPNRSKIYLLQTPKR